VRDDRGRSRSGKAQQPADVQITIVPDPDARSLRDRLTGIPRFAGVGVALIALIAGAVVSFGGRHRSPGLRSVEASARDRGVVGVATAYGQRLHCLKVTFAIDDPTYARADFDRMNACGQYDGDATAVFHRVGGSWRPVLDAVSYTCPVATLPARVQIELSVCPRPSK
jgi:hypothetical protein